jgi:hypothetical protein
MVQLEAGTLDLVDMPPINDTVRLQKDSAYQVLPDNLTGASWCLVPNCKRGPTSVRHSWWVRTVRQTHPQEA